MEKSAVTWVRGLIGGLVALSIVCGGAAYAAKLAGKKTAKARDPAPVPVYANWKCFFCKVQYGWSGTATLGLQDLSQGSYKYGEYTGLNRSGAYLDAGFDLHFLDKKGDYLYSQGRRLGLESRRVLIEGGRQGVYELTALYQVIPHYFYESAVTPFSNAGASSLVLPPNWTAGGSTAQMPDLAASLRPFDISKTRTIERVGLRLPPHKTHWSYNLGFQHEMQKGIEPLGGSFLTTSTLLPEPIDYATDQVNASANYAVSAWQVKLAYYGSFFHNSIDSVRWQNPFTPYVPGADVGQIGEAPSNNFNQLSAAGSWQLPLATRLMAMAAYGQGRQNAQFLPITINPDLQTNPLPRSSLDGEVITRNYVVRLNSNPVSRLSLTADYTYDRHQDLTPQALFPQVLTDTYVAAVLLNNPYSFERRNARVDANYRLNRVVRLDLGGEHRNEQQEFANTVDTRTNSIWVSSHIRPVDQVSLYLKYLSSRRVAPDYVSLADILSPENPLLRQYNVGDRNRKQGQATISYMPASFVDLSLQWQQNVDQYEATVIGLTSSRNTNYTINLGVQPTRHLSLGAYYTEERILNDQAGSQNFSTADWYGDQQDIVQTAGLNFDWKNIAMSHWGAGCAILYQLARGQIAVIRSAVPGAFPDIVEKMQGAQLYATRELSDHLALRFGYGFQRYRSNDWALDNVAPTTIPNVLTLGIQSPNYTINVVAVSVQYIF